MAGLRARLAEATADTHQALHGAAPFAAIEQGRLGLGGYGALLLLFHRYHAGMAPHCQAGAIVLHAPELADAHRARIARLQKDLIFLNLVPAAVAGEAAHDGAFSVGCLYTVLGSTLGGKVISRQLESLLPDGRGRSFFTGGTDDAAHWRLFCTRLEEADFAPAAVEAGARHAFGAFATLIEDWCDDVRPAPCAPGGAGGRWISSPRTE